MRLCFTPDLIVFNCTDPMHALEIGCVLSAIASYQGWRLQVDIKGGKVTVTGDKLVLFAIAKVIDLTGAKPHTIEFEP